MPRARGGVVLRRRHNKVLKITKGQRMSRHLLCHRANEAMLKSLFYASRDRRQRKRDMRGLWIARINAAARAQVENFAEPAANGAVQHRVRELPVMPMTMSGCAPVSTSSGGSTVSSTPL